MNNTTSNRRRRSRGNAWYWKQTDSWYYTQPGTKRRVGLFDERGQRIRGVNSKSDADLALARIKASGDWKPEPSVAAEPMHVVARVCSEYIVDVQRRSRQGKITADYADFVVFVLNELAAFCGRLPIDELKAAHVQHWIELRTTWRSLATHRAVIAVVQAAFNHARHEHGVVNPIKSLKKPPPQPRLLSLSQKEEEQLYGATDQPFRDFLFAAIHTGLRPFSELARLRYRDTTETDRGMLWHVFATKTQKRRTIPVRGDVADLVRKRQRESTNPDDVIFQNPQGNAWKKVTGVSRFRKIREALKWDRDPRRSKYSTYTCRHTFAHRMLAGYWTNGQGCTIETLAELLGDTPKVAFDHYGREWGQNFQDPLWAAIGVGT